MYGYTAHDTGEAASAVTSARPAESHPHLNPTPSLPSSYTRDPSLTLTPTSCASLRDYALLVLNTHPTPAKVSLTYAAFQQFTRHSLPLYTPSSCTLPPPPHPARPLDVVTVPPQSILPFVKGDPSGNRLRMLHSLAHIESYAIDLSWDILVRFMPGPLRSDLLRDITHALDLPEDTLPPSPPLSTGEEVTLPAEFYGDWLRVATEESRHFTCWANRLSELGSSYSAYPAHNGLWQSAEDTHHTLLGRLCVVHMVHEAHGLDASLRMARQLASSNDVKSQQLLVYIERDEQTHVAAGLRWFRWLVREVGWEEREVEVFHGLVRRWFRGRLRGPFNDEARSECGMGKEWYMPLCDEEEREGRERREREAEERDRERRERKEREQVKSRALGLQKQQRQREQLNERSAAAERAGI